MREPKQITAADLELAIRERYQPREWAVFAQVRNGTGYSKSVTRTADALALGLWPSRGMELHGFEIKTYRNDWLREGEEPEKAEEIAAYCDRWWIVAPPEVVADGELPPLWGLLEYRDGALVTVREAGKRAEAKALDRSFIAAVLRSAAKAEDAETRRVLQARVDSALKKERESNEAEVEHWKTACREAQEESRVARLLADKSDLAGQRYRLESIQHTAANILEQVGGLLASPPKASP